MAGHVLVGICRATPPKSANAPTWQPIQSGSDCVQRASASVKLEAPSTATNTCARLTSPVAPSITSAVCPAWSTNIRSPAGWVWRMVGDNRPRHAACRSQNRL